ncbi:MAG: GAF domain-containing protein [Ferruginibacter sp.]
MSENVFKIEGNLEEQYIGLLPQIEAIISDEKNAIANMANIAAVLKTQFNWLWVGFYIVNNDELVVGPYQGPLACTRIKKGRGVCGKSWETETAILVKDVNSFPDHIACSSLSRSEIVIPIFKDNAVCAILDVDSEELNFFTETDLKYLTAISALI